MANIITLLRYPLLFVYIGLIYLKNPAIIFWCVPFVVLIYLAFVATSALVGLQPPLMASLTGIKVWYVMGGAAALAGLILMIGFFMVGQSGKPRQPKAKKQPKPKKAKGKKK